MKIALLTTDSREHFKTYSETMPHFGMAPQALLQGFARIPEAEVHVVSCIRQPMQSPEKLAPNIWYHGLLVPKMGWLRTGYQGCIRASRHQVKSIQPDIVHGQGTERDCAINAIFSGFPSVLTIHGNMRLIASLNKARPLSFLRIAAWLEKFTIPRSAGVVCITRYTQEAVKDLARQTWVVPNAVDETFFDLQSEPDPARIILCVGLVCPRKNQNAFIRALDSLAEKTAFKVVFLGGARKENPYDAEFFELVAARRWCEYAGFADREKLKSWFKRASILALPSLEDNCPMVVLEAMAAGVPVLAANVGGVPELVTEGKTGILCDPLSAASMSAGIGNILQNAAMTRALTLAAREETKARFHPLAIARRHMEIYREVLSKVS